MVPPDSHTPGYFLDGASVSRCDGSVVVRKNDELEFQPGSQLLDCRPGDVLTVVGFEKGGDVIFIEVDGSKQFDRIDVETVDRYLAGDALTKA